MTRLHRGAWVAAVIVILVTFRWLLPWIAQRGPHEVTLDESTSYATRWSEVTIPAGWTIDIEQAADYRLVATKDGVTITVRDVMWLGEEQDLLNRVAEVGLPPDVNIPVIPDEPEDDESEEAKPDEVLAWRLTTIDPEPGEVVWAQVIKLDTSAVVVAVRGSAADRDALAEEIDAIVSRVTIGGESAAEVQE